MALRTLPVVAVLLLAVLPASAEFCAFDGAKKTDPSVRRLKEPGCTMENALVFRSMYNDGNRYGADEKKQTVLTDSWPGWGGDDKKCAAAAKSASTLVYSDETYILGKAVLLGPQVWRFSGSCDSFRSRFLAQQRKLQDKGGDSSHEAVFAAAGAVDVGMSALAARLVKGLTPRN